MKQLLKQGKLSSPYFHFVIATLLWGGNFVIGRQASELIPPYTLSFFRWLVAYLFLIALIGPRSFKKARNSISVKPSVIFFISITGIAGFNTLVYIALHYTNSINASLLQSCNPILIGLLSVFFLKEDLSKFQFAGSFLSLAGVVYIITKGSIASFISLTFNVGDMIMIIAVVTWAIYCILLRKYNKQLPLIGTFIVSVEIGTIILFPFSMWELFVQRQPIVWSFTSLLIILYIGIFASVIAFLAWNSGIAKLGSAIGGNFLNLIPIFASIFATVSGAEGITVYQMVGGILVMIGVIISVRIPKRKKSNSPHYNIS